MRGGSYYTLCFRIPSLCRIDLTFEIPIISAIVQVVREFSAKSKWDPQSDPQELPQEVTSKKEKTRKKDVPNLILQLQSPLFPTLFLSLDLLPSNPQPALVFPHPCFPFIFRFTCFSLDLSELSFQLCELV